jgi:DNA-binding SARP family transcriptional activator
MQPGARPGTSPPSTLRVRLLGGFDLAIDGRPIVTVDAPRLQSLLAHLVLHRDMPQPRERLAHLFWPDSSEPQARTNLRQALHLLRQALPEPERFLESETREVRWRPDARVEVDVAEFERLLREAGEARQAKGAMAERGALEGAVAVYTGDLLPGCYDDWVVPERQRLRELLLGAAERLADLLEDERDYRRATPWARRLLDEDPLNEEACRRLMRVHALSGDRAAALRVFHGFATALARDIGVEPGAAVQDDYRRLLEAEAAPPPRQAGGAAIGTLPLVGRHAEWETLRATWQRAAQGEALMGVIAAEAGVGKSRLAEELQGWVAKQGMPAAATRCYAARGRLAYAPVVELLRSKAVRPAVRRLGRAWLAELARLLPELLDEHPGLAPAPSLTDDWQRTRLFDALARAVLAGDGPLLLAIDDLQWCDRETLSWLAYLLRAYSQAPLLVLGTARSEEVPPEHPLEELLIGARADGQAVEIELRALDRTDTAALAGSLVGRRLDDERAEGLFRETEGNPLFVVEAVHAGFLDGPSTGPSQRTADTGRQTLPPRAHAVIEARLAQLSRDGQELASLAATVGRAFTFEVLAAASSQSEERLVEALDELWRRRIVRERAADAYDFSHDKIREAAYARAGPARRHLLHRRVAQALERCHAGDLDRVAAQLAAHYEQAGWAARAIDFGLRAARAAQRVYANEEALVLLGRALVLLRAQQPSKERDQRELAVQTALGVPLVITRGYGTREVTDTYIRAWELSERLGEPPSAPVMRGMGLAFLNRGELRRAVELAKRLLELGERDGDQMVRVEGDYLLGVTSFWLGDLAASRDHLERAIAGYLPERARAHLALYSQDPRIVCLSRLAYALWHLGHPAEAEAQARESLRRAEELEHPFSLSYALTFTSWLAIDSGDDERARELGSRLAGLAEEQQLGFLQPLGEILAGWRMTADGEADGGIARMRHGLDAYRRSGQTLYMPWALSLLTRVCMGYARLDAALHAVSEAIEIVDATGQRFLQPELQRLHGELIVADRGDRAEAESRFAEALELARSQGAAALERRVAASLERLRSERSENAPSA